MIATTRSKSLQSFEAMPTFLTEIWHYQILTPCRIICNIITPSMKKSEKTLQDLYYGRGTTPFWSATEITSNSSEKF